MPSSVIRTYHYEPLRQELHVAFRSGRHYVYREVPEGLYERMRAARSKGEFFNAYVRDQFEFVRRM